MVLIIACPSSKRGPTVKELKQLLLDANARLAAAEQCECISDFAPQLGYSHVISAQAQNATALQEAQRRIDEQTAALGQAQADAAEAQAEAAQAAAAAAVPNPNNGPAPIMNGGQPPPPQPKIPKPRVPRGKTLRIRQSMGIDEKEYTDIRVSME